MAQNLDYDIKIQIQEGVKLWQSVHGVSLLSK